MVAIYLGSTCHLWMGSINSSYRCVRNVWISLGILVILSLRTHPIQKNHPVPKYLLDKFGKSIQHSTRYWRQQTRQQKRNASPSKAGFQSSCTSSASAMGRCQNNYSSKEGYGCDCCCSYHSEHQSRWYSCQLNSPCFLGAQKNQLWSQS